MDFFDVLLRIVALFGAVGACVGIAAATAMGVALARGVIRDINRRST